MTVSPSTQRQERQWSLWSGWSTCSRSCGGGTKSRIRTCLHNGERIRKCTGDNVQVSDCNTEKCRGNVRRTGRVTPFIKYLQLSEPFAVPVVCDFTKLTPDKNLIGYLYINQEVQFGYSRREAEERCKLLRSRFMNVSLRLIFYMDCCGYESQWDSTQCDYFRVKGVCWGYALEYRDDLPFYVLKTSTRSTGNDEFGSYERVENWQMECSGNF